MADSSKTSSSSSSSSSSGRVLRYLYVSHVLSSWVSALFAFRCLVDCFILADDDHRCEWCMDDERRMRMRMNEVKSLTSTNEIAKGRSIVGLCGADDIWRLVSGLAALLCDVCVRDEAIDVSRRSCHRQLGRSRGSSQRFFLPFDVEIVLVLRCRRYVVVVQLFFRWDSYNASRTTVMQTSLSLQNASVIICSLLMWLMFNASSLDDNASFFFFHVRTSLFITLPYHPRGCYVFIFTYTTLHNITIHNYITEHNQYNYIYISLLSW